MSDLYIDGAMLDRVRSNFANITELLRAPARSMKELDAREVGHGHLEDKLDDFRDEWDHGIGELGEFSESVVGALDAIKKAFEDADTNLADALNEAKE